MKKMKIQPDPNCKLCMGTGETFDWVDYGSTQVKLDSLCECVLDQLPDDFDDQDMIDLDLSEIEYKDNGYDTLEEKYGYE